MVNPFREKLVEALKESKLITEEQLKQVLAIHKKEGGNLANIIVKEGLVKEQDLIVLLSSSLNLPVLSLSRFKIDPELIKLIPEKLAKQYRLIPVSAMGNNLTVCMADPLNIFAIDDIKALTSYNIEPVISTEKEIAEAIHNYYGTEATQLANILKEVKETDENEPLEVATIEEEVVDIEQAQKQSKVTPIVKVVNLMLTEALENRASDIHVEPEEANLRVRYRIDGALREAFTLPKKDQNAVLTRLKIMSGLDITEWRIPQDGRFRIRMRDKEVDFRVSVLPTNHGGKVVMRALDKSSLSIGLDKLGYLPEPLEGFKKAVAKPYGMILVTGPTGSGKSTTLYSIINQLNTPEKNIVTIEDPVEYQMEGITQIQANPEIKLTFASGLRSILRQTPDIVLIGEIRDFETADIAIKASLTGQLLLSTLHTNDACGAITRLVDMGVEPFLVASSLIVAAAQRLCRKVCPNCKEPHEVTDSVIKRLGIEVKKNTVFYRGKGCNKCNGSGYFGRMGTLEILLIDEEIREMIIKKKSSDEIKEYAISKGMKTLRDNAFQKTVMGLTTIEEVLRITTEE
ncbi:MAG: Flp pilus assembly complex ATPase component TadA [Candidatus Omnitrophica bacterium]|nr:Flp pilus assembly complex ATPase component TadA [Candidatus Omnitrophota bacterium]